MRDGKKLKSALSEDLFPAKPAATLTSGQMLRVLREKNEFSQNDLAEATGLTQPTISGLENDRITLGVERAKSLAIALQVHPAVLIFPDLDQNMAA